MISAKVYRVLSYIAAFNLGSCTMAAMATWLVNKNVYPDIQVTWRTWANIIFWTVATIVFIVSSKEKKN